MNHENAGNVASRLFRSAEQRPISALALTYTWKIANPTNIVAYQVGKGVITVASDAVICHTDKLVPGATPFNYTFEVGTPVGIRAWPALGSPPYTAPVAAYYEIGSPTTVTVQTKAGAKTVTVSVPPPQNPAIGHLPFH